MSNITVVRISGDHEHIFTNLPPEPSYQHVARPEPDDLSRVTFASGRVLLQVSGSTSPSSPPRRPQRTRRRTQLVHHRDRLLRQDVKVVRYLPPPPKTRRDQACGTSDASTVTDADCCGASTPASSLSSSASSQRHSLSEISRRFVEAIPTPFEEEPVTPRRYKLSLAEMYQNQLFIEPTYVISPPAAFSGGSAASSDARDSGLEGSEPEETDQSSEKLAKPPLVVTAEDETDAPASRADDIGLIYGYTPAKDQREREEEYIVVFQERVPALGEEVASCEKSCDVSRHADVGRKTSSATTVDKYFYFGESPGPLSPLGSTSSGDSSAAAPDSTIEEGGGGDLPATCRLTQQNLRLLDELQTSRPAVSGSFLAFKQQLLDSGDSRLLDSGAADLLSPAASWDRLHSPDDAASRRHGPITSTPLPAAAYRAVEELEVHPAPADGVIGSKSQQRAEEPLHTF